MATYDTSTDREGSVLAADWSASVCNQGAAAIFPSLIRGRRRRTADSMKAPWWQFLPRYMLDHVQCDLALRIRGTKRDGELCGSDTRLFRSIGMPCRTVTGFCVVADARTDISASVLPSWAKHRLSSVALLQVLAMLWSPARTCHGWVRTTSSNQVRNAAVLLSGSMILSSSERAAYPVPERCGRASVRLGEWASRMRHSVCYNADGTYYELNGCSGTFYDVEGVGDSDNLSAHLARQRFQVSRELRPGGSRRSVWHAVSRNGTLSS